VKKLPKVSVVIPACNVAQHVGDARESVFAQSFTDFEVEGNPRI